MVCRAGWQALCQPPGMMPSSRTDLTDIALAIILVPVADLPSVLTRVRGAIGTRAILALLADDRPETRTAAINAGADDAQPMRIEEGELVARIKALVRRHAFAEGRLACDDLAIDLVGREVRRGGRLIVMPQREFHLVARLAMSADQIVSRDDLWRTVWRIDFDPGTNRIDVHMSRLRQRIDAGHSHALLRTAKGRGYALVSRAGAGRFARMVGQGC